METPQPSELVTITPLENSTVEIVVEVPAAFLPHFRTKALASLSSRLNISGFRKGHVPEKTLVEYLGEAAILEETASVAVRDVFPRIIAKHHIAAIGEPRITVTKLAPDNPICFSIKTAVLPPVTLPDYRTIAHKILEQQKPVSVEKDEVEAALLQIRKALSMKEGDAQKQEAEGGSEPEPPGLTLEMVHSIGDFPSIDDFVGRLKAQITHEKESRSKEQGRSKIAEELVKTTSIDLPDILIEAEVNKMLFRLKEDLSRSGSTFEEYLVAAKTTDANLKTMWRPDAQKQATLQLILNTIADQENIHPDSNTIEEQMKVLVQGLKNPNMQAARRYVEMVLTNAIVFEFLENV
jgi:FKBP-type peptidyl-prolyl cis-trans isomerase (trigger factor)